MLTTVSRKQMYRFFVMTSFLRVFAYICIWTTPFQIGIVLWALGIVFTGEATLLSLSNDIFLGEYLPFLHSLLKPFTYFVLPEMFAEFVWSLPVILHQFSKAVLSTWLGLWILKQLRQSP